MLVCPRTKQPVTLTEKAFLKLVLRPGTHARGGVAADSRPLGQTSTVMLRADGRAAYPVLDGLPMLLAPEMLFVAEETEEFDLSDPKYSEAYEERRYYQSVAADVVSNLDSSEALATLRPLIDSPSYRSSFPHPLWAWLDATYDCVAQERAYDHIGPVYGKVILQLGGSGGAAVRFLLAGAEQAWLLTPMPTEAQSAMQLAGRAGVGDRLRCVAGVAEELPFADETFDAVYAGGCLHHTVTDYAIPELARVLRPGGRFAAIDPWRAPLYLIGTRLLGKRERGVACRPLTPARVRPLAQSFPRSEVSLHGTVTRYPLIALWKAGLKLPLRSAYRIMSADDRLCSRLPRLRRYGSSVAVLASK